MESIARIRRMYHVDGKAIRAIAKELNISKNTVKKVIRSNETKFELAKYTRDKPVLGAHLDNLLITTLSPIRRHLNKSR